MESILVIRYHLEFNIPLKNNMTCNVLYDGRQLKKSLKESELNRVFAPIKKRLLKQGLIENEYVSPELIILELFLPDKEKKFDFFDLREDWLKNWGVIILAITADLIEEHKVFDYYVSWLFEFKQCCYRLGYMDLYNEVINKAKKLVDPDFINEVFEGVF